MLSESITCDNIMSENSHLHEAPAILFWDSVQASFFYFIKKKEKDSVQVEKYMYSAHTEQCPNFFLLLFLWKLVRMRCRCWTDWHRDMSWYQVPRTSNAVQIKRYVSPFLLWCSARSSPNSMNSSTGFSLSSCDLPYQVHTWYAILLHSTWALGSSCGTSCRNPGSITPFPAWLLSSLSVPRCHQK